MSDIIKLLPDSIANQIAAGEVVQRPASVLKELVENAVDAGATEVLVIVKEAGKSLIQVVDNGVGMTETDARMSFERHATSKIESSEDLGKITSLGFRGEALASIAAVAQVEVKTHHADREVGTALKIEGTKVLSQEPTSLPIGTNISIKNLFFNTPARKKFLKSDAVEMKHIIEEFRRIALANPGLQFALHHSDRELYRLAKGNLRQRLLALFGKKNNEKWVPVDEITEIVKISGFISKPEFAKRSRDEQYYFVNNRFIKSPYLRHAISTAYKDLLAEGMSPSFCIFLELDPGSIDVNVHPTKHEVKFQDERLIYRYLLVCARHALGKFNISPSLQFDPGLEQYTPSSIPNRGSSQDNRSDHNNLREWRKAFDGIDQFTIPSVEHERTRELFDNDESQNESLPSQFGEQSSSVGAFQIHNRYIVTQIKSGLIIIDQKIAHERILYEKWSKLSADKKLPSQQLLFPITINVNGKEAHLLLEHLDLVRSMGFDIEDFGQQSFVIRGAPVGIEESHIETIIDSIITDLLAEVDVHTDLHDEMRKHVVRYMTLGKNKRLTQMEMNEIITSLFACEMPYKGPNGSYTLITLELDELERRFNS